METNEKDEVVSGSELDPKELQNDGVGETLDENPKGLETEVESEEKTSEENESGENSEENFEEEYDDDEQTTVLTADMMGIPNQGSGMPGSMNQPMAGMYGQPGPMNQPTEGMYGQPGPMNQPMAGMYGQLGPMNQPREGMYGQPGPAYQSVPGMNGQPSPGPGMYNQPMPGMYGQTGPMNQPPISNGYVGPENMGYFPQGQPAESKTMDPIRKAKLIRGFKFVSLGISAVAVVTVIIFLIVAVIVPGGSKYSGSAAKGYNDISSVTDAEPDEKAYTDTDADNNTEDDKKED